MAVERTESRREVIAGRPLAALRARRRQVSVALVVVLSICIIAGIWQLLQLRGNIDVAMDELHAAQFDNRTWTISQAETDMLGYRLALIEARDGPSPEAIEKLRQRFDIFYSRVATISNTLNDPHFQDAPELLQAWTGIAEMTQHNAAIFDAGDGVVLERLGQLEAEVAAAAPGLRSFVVQALQHITSDSLTLRVGTHALLDNFFSWTVVMIGLLIALAIGVLLSLYWIVRYARLKTHLSARQTKVINAAIDAVLICDSAGRILEFNSTASEMFRLEDGNEDPPRLDMLFLPGHPGHGLSDTAGAEPPVAHWRQLAESSTAVTSAVRRHDGVVVPVECVFTVDREMDGPTIFIVFIHDISKQIEHEHRLRAARDAAEQGERVKSRFLAVMSHEMRTPLNGLIAALDILRQTSRLTQRQERFLTIAQQCGKTTLEQIDDVLELTRLDVKTPQEEAAAFDLSALLRGLVEQYQPMAALRGDVISLHLPDPTGPWVVGPQRTVGRIVINLLGNAVKFTQDGSIDVRLAVSAPEAGFVQIRLDISDTGTGIDPAKLEVIFQDFETLNQPGQQAVQGTGLGLGIVRRALDRLGGTVNAVSTPGKGSTFTVRLSLPRAAVPAPEPVEPVRKTAIALPEGQPALRDKTVLIAEDNEINRLVLGEMLRHLGARVDQATDGQDAVIMAARKPYDLVVMDLSMPKVDGIEATRRIREGGTSAGSRIVGLTAHAAGDQLDMMRAAGMDLALSKPVTFEKLRELLSESGMTSSANEREAAGPMLAPQTLRDLKLSLPPHALQDLLRRYELETDDLLRGLESDPPDADLLHRLAGSAAVLGAATLGKLLLEVEDLCRKTGQVPAAKLDDLRQCWRQTRGELHDWMRASSPATTVDGPIL